MKSIEDYLKENCKLEDWNRLEENLKDSLITNNIIEYMKGYSKLVVEECAERAVADYTKHSNGLDEEFIECYVIKGSILEILTEIK